MKNIIQVVILIVSLDSISYHKLYGGYNYNKGKLPELPINMAEFNTEFDDYNLTEPTFGYLIPFCFSTNRHSNGSDFDIIYRSMNVNFDKTTAALNATNEYANWHVFKDRYEVIKKEISKIKTIRKEYGLYLIGVYRVVSWTQSMMIFSSNRTDGKGGFDLYYVGVEN